MSNSSCVQCVDNETPQAFHIKTSIAFRPNQNLLNIDFSKKLPPAHWSKKLNARRDAFESCETQSSLLMEFEKRQEWERILSHVVIVNDIRQEKDADISSTREIKIASHTCDGILVDVTARSQIISECKEMRSSFIDAVCSLVFKSRTNLLKGSVPPMNEIRANCRLKCQCSSLIYNTIAAQNRKKTGVLVLSQTQNQLAR